MAARGAPSCCGAVRAAGLRTALVTTTPRRLAEIVLGSIRADLGDDPFDVTVCGDEVPARKPDPAPYRQAMDALGVEPGDCLVIEDSRAGIGAGLAAGDRRAWRAGRPGRRAGCRADRARVTGRHRVAGLEPLLQPRDLVPIDA